MKNAYSTVILILISLALNAQPSLSPCGTPDVKSEWLTRFQQNPHQYQRSDELYYIPMKIHIVGTDSGNGHYPMESLLEAFCILNDNFMQTDIQFYIADIDYINNSDYYVHDWGTNLVSSTNSFSYLDTYIVSDPAGTCGYAISGNDGGVVLSKSCVLEGPTWEHELGHFFSLPHTFYFWDWEFDHDYSQPAPNYVSGILVERVNGSNCHMASDGFCDTPPDYLFNRWDCNEDSESDIIQTDPTGETFRSDGTLFMSYANGYCRNRFSDQQIDAIRANLEEEYPFLISDDMPEASIPDQEYPLTSPEENEVVPYYNQVTLEWDSVPNATHYLVQITRAQTFNNFTDTYVVNNNSITLTDLLADKNYKWRIKPYNAYHTCAEFSETGQFTTGELLSSARDIGELSSFEVHPNPLSTDQELVISIQSNRPFEGQLTLQDLTGRLIKTIQQSEFHTGQNQVSIALDDLSRGVYLLSLKSDTGIATKRVVVK